MHDLNAAYGLKFNPFRPDIPIDALYVSKAVEIFCRRIDMTVKEGGFGLINGPVGAGKSAAVRLVEHRLSQNHDLHVARIEHPQSTVTDFYRELGEGFGLSFGGQARWKGFKSLRARWNEHIVSTLKRPVVIIDEAQEMLSSVLTEIRILSSKDFDARSLLCVILAGDGRLTERLKKEDLLPLGSRIRRRLILDYVSRQQLCACIDHVLEAAGNPSLMTTELKTTLAEHAAGNYRVMMNMADELLIQALEQQRPQLDETLFFEVFKPAEKNRRRK